MIVGDRIIRVLVLIGIASSCAPKIQEPAPGDVTHAALVLLPGALAVRPSDGGLSVEYELQAPYPAAAVVAALGSTLEKAGWYPLPHDLFNPTIESSHARGWTRYLDGTVTPKVRVHQWAAGWANDQGDAVTYSLRYRSLNTEAPEPATDRLTIAAGFLPAATLKASGVVVPPRQKP